MRKLIRIYLASLLFVPSVAWAGDKDYYRYTLEQGKDLPVCQRMAKVYNQDFARPWDIFQYRKNGEAVSHDMYRRLPGVSFDPQKAFNLETSKFPSIAEFEAIPWQEGRLAQSKENESIGILPILLAEFDINNDGRKEWVIQTSFMRAWSPSACKGSGGEDRFYVVASDRFDPSRVDQPIPYSAIFLKDPPLPVPLDSFTLLKTGTRSIRPFVFDGITYLNVYGKANSSCQRPYASKDTLWVLKYSGVKDYSSHGKNVSLNVEKICRFRINLTTHR